MKLFDLIKEIERHEEKKNFLINYLKNVDNDEEVRFAEIDLSYTNDILRYLSQWYDEKLETNKVWNMYALPFDWGNND